MPKNVTQQHFDLEMHCLRDELDQKFVTKDEFNEFRYENTTRLDEILNIVRRLDQERLFTFEWIRRIEGDVATVKQHLKLA